MVKRRGETFTPQSILWAPLLTFYVGYYFSGPYSPLHSDSSSLTKGLFSSLDFCAVSNSHTTPFAQDIQSITRHATCIPPPNPIFPTARNDQTSQSHPSRATLATPSLKPTETRYFSAPTHSSSQTIPFLGYRIPTSRNSPPSPPSEHTTQESRKPQRRSRTDKPHCPRSPLASDVYILCCVHPRRWPGRSCSSVGD